MIDKIVLVSYPSVSIMSFDAFGSLVELQQLF